MVQDSPKIQMSRRIEEDEKEELAIQSVDELQTITTLGSGGFGVVKLVKHEVSGECYALKCQSKAVIIQNDMQTYILNEKRLLQLLHHPFILRLHQSLQDDRYVYFILELLIGGELYGHLRKRGTFEENDVRFYTAQVGRVRAERRFRPRP